MVTFSISSDLGQLLRTTRLDRSAEEDLARQLQAGWAICVRDFAVLHQLALPSRQGADIAQLASALGVQTHVLLQRYVALERRGLVQRVARSAASDGCVARTSSEGHKVLEAVRPLISSFLMKHTTVPTDDCETIK